MSDEEIEDRYMDWQVESYGLAPSDYIGITREQLNLWRLRYFYPKQAQLAASINDTWKRNG